MGDDDGIPDRQSRGYSSERERWQMRQPRWQRPPPLTIAPAHRGRVIWWLLGVFGAFLILAFALAVVSAEQERGKVGSALKSYVSARASGNAAAACDRMTQGEWRDLVSRSSGSQVPSATHAECERWVLTTSDESPYTSPDIDRFRRNGYEFKIDFGPAREVATVYPKGLTAPVAELIKVGGAWKVDGLANEKIRFIEGCDQIAHEGDCGCIFDRLRAHSYDRWSDFRAALSMMRSGEPSLGLDGAQVACAGSLPGAPRAGIE